MTDLTRTNDHRWATWGDASDAEIDEYRRHPSDPEPEAYWQSVRDAAGIATHHGPWCDDDPAEACLACREPVELPVRLARCECLKTKPSSPFLPWFTARPDDDFDKFYDGCAGWD